MNSKYPLPPMTPDRQAFEAYMAAHLPEIDYDTEVAVNGCWLCGLWLAARQGMSVTGNAIARQRPVP